MRSPIFLALSLSALAVSPLAAEPLGGSGSTTAASPALARALDTVRAENLEADVHFIASDQLEGRDTPSPGLRIAARFLRARLERLGWEPGAGDGYLYDYSLQKKRVDLERTRARLVGADREIDLQVGTDYCFSSRSLQFQERFAPLVWCGEGSTEDLAGLDLTDRIALVQAPTAGSWYPPYKRVQAAGPLELVWVAAPDAEEEPFGENWADWWTSLQEGRTGWPASPDDEPSFSTMSLSNARAAELFELAGYGSGRPAPGAELPVRLADDRAVDPDSPRIPLENVCGFWPGSDPELADEVILVSAHYDHVGVQDGEIYNGADDNGSGTCTLLAVAEALVRYGPMRRSVMLLWVSGEEKGLQGSKAWSLSPSLPDGTHAVCDINIDMVGRNDPQQLLITPTSEHDAYNGLTRLAEALAPSEGFPELGSADEFYHRSDHAMFQENLGIPVCFLFSGVHEDYHKPTDTADKLDYDKVRRVSRLVLKLLDGLQTDVLDL